MNIAWNIKRFIRCSFLGKSSLYHDLRFTLKKKGIKKVIEKFGASDMNISEYEKFMKEAFVKYHWDFDEFFMYHFLNLNDEQRKSFVPEYEKNIFCDKVNDNSKDLIFHDKWETYKFFEKYFKRDVVFISDSTDVDKDVFTDFCNKHNKFIVKPINAATGRGIKILSTNELKELKNIVQEVGPVVVEQLVVQSVDMAKLHPASVNTLRITTFRFNDRIEYIHPFMRVGRGNSVVDNGGQGGLICIIDKDKGVVTNVADEILNKYDKHPDTGLNLKGFAIPKWNEALKLAKELADLIPSVRYVGWDLALTDNGWVLIEGNEKGQFVGWQLVNQHGFRKELEEICNQINIRL